MKRTLESLIWRINNQEKLLLNVARSRAKKSGKAFTITLADVRIPAVCPFLKQPFVTGIGKGYDQMAPSLDRIDNTKGYIPGNVQVLSRLANSMKSSATPEQIVEFAKNALEIYK